MDVMRTNIERKTRTKKLFINLEDSESGPPQPEISTSPPLSRLRSAERLDRDTELPEEKSINVFPEEIKREIVPQTLNDKKKALLAGGRNPPLFPRNRSGNRIVSRTPGNPSRSREREEATRIAPKHSLLFSKETARKKRQPCQRGVRGDSKFNVKNKLFFEIAEHQDQIRASAAGSTTH